jgi:hypothetical protein
MWISQEEDCEILRWHRKKASEPEMSQAAAIVLHGGAMRGHGKDRFRASLIRFARRNAPCCIASG